MTERDNPNNMPPRKLSDMAITVLRSLAYGEVEGFEQAQDSGTWTIKYPLGAMMIVSEDTMAVLMAYELVTEESLVVTEAGLRVLQEVD